MRFVLASSKVIDVRLLWFDVLQRCRSKRSAESAGATAECILYPNVLIDLSAVEKQSKPTALAFMTRSGYY